MQIDRQKKRKRMEQRDRDKKLNVKKEMKGGVKVTK